MAGQGFVAAEKLKPGMTVSRWSPSASPLQTVGFRAAEAATGHLLVKAITITRSGLKKWRAYNLTVEGDHTYFVGKTNAWVHNSCDLVGFRRDHILNRHRAGVGKSGKTEFPSRWSDDKIIHEISDVATDPSLIRRTGKYGDYVVGMRNGIRIRVDFYPNNHPKYPGKISTGYPLNTRPNP